MKIHQLEYEVVIDRLSIEIKFPCKIMAAFRVGKHQGHSEESVSLENGIAKFSQPINAKGQMHVIDGKYQEKKAYLTIYVVSNSGKNIAGVCTLDMAALTTEQWQTMDKQLERCPDRNARIVMKIRSSFVREVEDTPSESSHSDSYRNLKELIRREQTPKQLLQIPNSNNLSLPDARSLKAKPPLHTPSRQTHTRFGSTSYLPDNIRQHSAAHSFRGEQLSARVQQQDRNRQISNLKDEVTERQRKITRLEVEKQSYLREVEGLRGQLEGVKGQLTARSNKEVELVGENEKLKRKIEASENALEILKMKKAEWEKRETERRQLSLNEKNLVEDLRNKTESVAELEKELKVSKKAREDLDKMLRDKMREFRELSEKYDDQMTTIATLEKRLEMKESFFKEEVRKYGERQGELENQRQRMYAEMSSLRQALDDRQRKLSQQSKDSQKTLLQQRSKLFKTCQSQKSQLQHLQSTTQTLTKQLTTQSEQLDRLQKQFSDSTQQLEKVKLQLDRTKKQLVLQSSYRAKYEESQKQKVALRQQKTQLQKELDEAVMARGNESQELGRQVTEKGEQMKNLNQRITQVNRKLREKETKIQEIQSNADALTKKYELLRKSDEKKALDITALKNNQKSLLLDLQALDQENQQLKLTIQNMKFKQQAQIEELRKLLRRSSEQSESLKTKLRNQSDNSAKLAQNQKILNERNNVNTVALSKLEERAKKADKELMDAEFRQKNLKEQLQRLNVSLSQTKQAFKRQSHKNEQNYLKLTKLESENLKLGFSVEQLARFEKQLKQKDAELTAKHDNEAKMEIQIQRLQGVVAGLKDELRNRVADLNREKQTTEALRKEQVILNDSIQTVQRQLQQKTDQATQLKRQLGKASNDFKTCQQRLNTSVSDLKKYRQTTVQSLKSCFSYLFSSRQTQQQQPQFSDYQLTELQRELTRKLNKLVQQHSSQLQICKQHLQQTYKQQLGLANSKHEQIYSQMKAEAAAKEEELHYFREGMIMKNDELMRELQNMQVQLNAAVEDVQVLCQEKEEVLASYRRLLIENQELKAICDQKDRETTNMARDVKQLQEEITRQRQHKQQLFTKVYSQRQATHTQMQAAQRAMALQIQQLQSTLRDRQSQLDNSSTQLRALGKQLELRDMAVKNLQKQLAHGSAVNNQLEGHINNLMKREKELLEKVRMAEQAVMLEQEKLGQVRAGLGMVQVREREIQEIRHAFDREREAFGKKVATLEHEVRNSGQALSKAKEQIEHLHEELSYTSNQMRRVSESCKTLEENIIRKSQQLEQKNSQLISTKQKLSRLELELITKDDLRTDLTNRYQSQLRSLSQQRDQLIFHLNQLQSDLKRSTQESAHEYKQLEKQAVKLRNDRQRLSTQLSTVQQQCQLKIQSLKRQLQGPLIAQNLSIRAFLFQTQKQNQHLQQSLEQLEMQHNQLIKHNQQMNFDCNSLEQRNQHLEGRLRELEAELQEGNKDRVREMERDREDMRREVARIGGRLQDAQQELERLAEYSRSLEQAVEKYKEDKEFVYRQLREEVSRSGALAKQKQQLIRVHEDKINSMLHLSSQSAQQHRQLHSTISQLTQKLNSTTSQITSLQFQNHSLQSRLQQSNQQQFSTIQKLQSEIAALESSKAQLNNNIEQITTQVVLEKQELDKMYDKEIRDIEAKRIQEAKEADERIKRVYKEKYEDQSVLKFEIERLKTELANTQRSRQPSSATFLETNRSEYKQQMSQAKMKHFLAEQPLRNLQSLIPHIIWLCKQNQKLMQGLQSRIQQLESRSQMNSRYISPMKVMQETIHAESQLIEKLRESDLNVRITFQRVEEMAVELEQLTEEKLKILGKSRELREMLVRGNSPVDIQDKVSEILDYSRFQRMSNSVSMGNILHQSPSLIFNNPHVQENIETPQATVIQPEPKGYEIVYGATSPFNAQSRVQPADRSQVSIKRVQSGLKVIPIQSWLGSSSRRILPNN